MKPRKILYVTRIVDGGVATVIDNLARGLDRNCFEPIVLFDSTRQSTFRRNLSRSNIKTVDLAEPSQNHVCPSSKGRKNRQIAGKVETLFGKKASGIYFSLKAFFEFSFHQAPKIRLFLKAIRQNKIDLVHTHHNLTLCKPELIAARIAGTPLVSHRHGYTNLTAFDIFFARFVDSTIYISNDVARYYIAKGEDTKIGKVIHNGIDFSAFAKTHNPLHIHSEFGCQPKQPLVGLIGRIDWWKGHDYFIEAIAEVAKQHRDVKALIIGGVEDRIASDRNRQYLDKLHALVKSFQLEERIIFSGFRSDVPRIMSALDVVVHASSEPEPFGLVVIEGMAAGKPVVATAAGGVLDIIEDGVNGLLVPCKDSKAMAQAIIKILSDRDKAEQMGNAARQRILDNFTVEQQVTAVQKVYDSLCVT